MNRDQIIKKLEKIKALAERGVGGEKETAQRMYKDLKANTISKTQKKSWKRLKDVVQL